MARDHQSGLDGGRYNMNQETTPPVVSKGDDELAHNADLFLEADRLEVHAYSLLDGNPTRPIS
jgi:hypothetical protein